MNTIKLFIYRILDFLNLYDILPYNKNKARIDGFNLFPDEYNNISKFTDLHDLLRRQTTAQVIRIPFSHGHQDRIPRTIIQNVIRTAAQSRLADISPVILLDQFYNHKSMIQRLDVIRSMPNIQYIQLFNELPHMLNDYHGYKHQDADELIKDMNVYCHYIRRHMPNIKIISMPTYNILDNRYHKIWKISNRELTRRITLEVDCDITALHCYGMSFNNKVELDKLRKQLNDWHTQAEKQYGKRKAIWITECGASKWGNHIKYYQQWCSRLSQYLQADKIIWYRATIDKKESQDSGFALEIREPLDTSPLLSYLADR